MCTYRILSISSSMCLGSLGRCGLQRDRHTQDSRITSVRVEVGDLCEVHCGGVAYGFETSGGIEGAGRGAADGRGGGAFGVDGGEGARGRHFMGS